MPDTEIKFSDFDEYDAIDPGSAKLIGLQDGVNAQWPADAIGPLALKGLRIHAWAIIDQTTNTLKASYNVAAIEQRLTPGITNVTMTNASPTFDYFVATHIGHTTYNGSYHAQYAMMLTVSAGGDITDKTLTEFGVAVRGTNQQYIACTTLGVIVFIPE